ncbi:MAG TPA: O-antigen ligase family protein [Candidatus Baltobacteraceae bacterium]|nr:O-antigen ligase family protein [Candidatus Baltobacteraceae bacterium]
MLVHRRGFRAYGGEARRVIIDPLTAILYTGVLVAVTLLTMRRPYYGVCALIAVQPFAFYQDVFATTLTLSKVVLVGVLLGLLAYPWAFAALRAPAPQRLIRAGLLVLGATVLTFAVATYHDAVVRESLKLIEYLLLFSVVVAAYRLDPQPQAIRTTVLLTTLTVALLALLQEIVGAPSAMLLGGHAIPRIAGPIEGPNQLAGYFDVALPLVLTLAIEQPAPAALVTLFFIVAADVLTFSRGGILGAVAGTACVLFVLRRNVRAPLTALLTGLGAGIAVALSWGVLANTLGLERFWDFRQSDYAGGVGTRPQLWHAAWTLWLKHPLLGVGAGNFEREIPLTGLHGVRTHSNSLYLQSLVEGGVVLFAATLWLVYTSIATFIRPRLSSPFMVAALAASVALALHQIVDLLTFYPKVGGEWWIVMALGAACA